MKQAKHGISGSTLKLIAVTVMLIDHIGAVILQRVYLMRSMEKAITDAGERADFMRINLMIVDLNLVMRLIGRLGFPIFCFLLVEGFIHTRNRWNYAGRLALFVLISEVPFDLALKGSPFDMGMQNVFLTLFLGLLVLIGFCMAAEQEKIPKLPRVVIQAAVLAAGMGAAHLLRADYGAFGVAAIAVLYVCRQYKSVQVTAGCVLFSWELTAPLAFIPIALYNGERGWNLKYIFYLFYPLHLLLLYGIAMMMGLPPM